MRFVAMTPLVWNSIWKDPLHAFRSSHTALVIHFAEHLPACCHCFELQLVMDADDLLTVKTNIDSFDWTEFGCALRRIDALECVVVRLYGDGDVADPLWSLGTLEVINQGLKMFKRCARERRLCLKAYHQLNITIQ